MKKRTWHYVNKPIAYDIKCDICGSDNTHWSEFESMIWCYACQKDTRGTLGVFGGPIPLGTALMMGYNFDRFNMLTEKVEKLNKDDLAWS